MSVELKLGVALSGSGTTLQNILDRSLAGELAVRVAAVVSSDPEAYGLERARRAGVPAATFVRKDYRGRKSFSRDLFGFFEEHGVDCVALAGFLKRLWLPPAWEGRVLNIHPALLPDFGGKGMYLDHVHEAVLAAGAAESGCSVHVVDDEYDHGEVVLQRRVPVLEGDTVETLKARVLEAEREAYPEALELFAERLRSSSA